MTRSLALVLLAFAGTAAACSLVLPFDDYREQGRADAGTVTPTPTDGGDGAPITDSGAPDGTTPACVADLSNDSRNCGVCGRVCAEGGVCANGRCPITTVVDLKVPSTTIGDLVIANGPNGGEPAYVYFTVSTGGIGRFVLPSGTPEYALAPLVIDHIGVGVTGEKGVITSGATIYGFDASDFTAAPVLYGTYTNVAGIAAYGSPPYYFWSDDTVSGSAAFSKPDASTSLGTGPSKGGFVALADRLVWVTADGKVWGLVTPGPGDIPKSLFETGLKAVSHFDANKTNFYLMQDKVGIVAYAWDARSGVFSKAAPATTAMTKPMAIVAGAFNIWAIDAQGGGPDTAELQRYPVGGGQKVVLISSFRPTGGVAFRDDFIYVADGPHILRTTK